MFTPLTHQVSFASITLQALSKSKTAKFLNQIDKKIDWKEIEALLKPLYCDDNGRPSFSPITLFKGLLLEQWYQLSDRALEEGLKDRLSFRNFVGLDPTKDAPDETTMVRFRERLRKKGLEEKLFQKITDLLRKDNVTIKQGKCVLTDASIVESPYGTKPKGKDGNGDFVKRGELVTKGYKAHVVTNQHDGLAEGGILTVASCHESRFLEQTLDKVEGNISSVIADKGYASDERKRDFRQKGMYYGILEKPKRNHHPLTQKQREKNKRLSRIRAPIERVFAVIKKHYGFWKVRYFGLEKNTAHLWYILTAYNLQLVTLKSLDQGIS